MARGSRIRTALLLFGTATVLSSCARTEAVTIYRDDYGIPHIYASTAEAGLYGSGWAMAEDALDRTLQNYLRGLGRFSEFFGAGENDQNVRADLESLLWDHYGTAQRRYLSLPEDFRSHNAAFVAGLNAYMREHPEAVPVWWTLGEVDVYMPVAFSRQFIWGWPAGQAASDLRKIGLQPSYDVDFRSSNEIAIAPERTTFGAAALVIDPHLSWYGRFRYWELRMHAGDIHISGFATAGFPYVNLGHNRHVAWAHTTGGPDTGDIFELTLDPENPLRYLYDGEYRNLVEREVVLEVQGEVSPRRVTLVDSHYGPIVARRGDRAYAAALAYADEIGYLESKYYFMKARNYEDVIEALKVRQIMPQNVMVADTEGNIYYQRTGRVPIRPAAYDYSRPVDGSTSATEWQGVHPTEDLIQILNPPQGYMQNCNISPDVMMVASPLTADRYPPYIFNQPPRTTHQRANRAIQLLDQNDKVSIEDLLEMALDKQVYQYDRWVQQLTWADGGREDDRSADYARGLAEIQDWDGRTTKDSAAALKYYYWRRALIDLVGRERAAQIRQRVDDNLELFRPGAERARLPRTEGEALVEALDNGLAQQRADHGHLDSVYGDVFRAGRLDYDDEVSFPVGGGSLRAEGMATLRAIGFSAPRDDHTRWGVSGQTSTAVVILTDPIQSFTQPPLGQSDHPDSPHFRDQAEDLLSGSRFKPSWFNEEDLLAGHVQSTLQLEYRRP